MPLDAHDEHRLISIILLLTLRRVPTKHRLDRLLTDISRLLPESQLAEINEHYFNDSHAHLFNSVVELATDYNARSFIDQMKNTVDLISRRIDIVFQRAAVHGMRLDNIDKYILDTDASLSELIWTMSIKAEYDRIKTIRRLPVIIYLSDAKIKEGDSIVAAIFDALNNIGIVRSSELPPESGSWYKIVWGKTTDALSQEEVVERLRKLEHAAELKLVAKPQAEVTHLDAESITKLIKAIDKIPNACMQVGPLLIIKTTLKKSHSNIVIRTLGASELIAINRNRSILKSPRQVLELLDRECLRVDESTEC